MILSISGHLEMDIETLREYCLDKPGVEEALPFGPDTLVYKVNGKIFLITGLDEETLSFNVKCDPELAVELREKYDCVKPGYHMNKKHWNTITADGSVPNKKLIEWVDHSYQLVAKTTPQKMKKRSGK